MADKTEYGKPVPKTWDEAVKAAGSEEEASIQYPTLSPTYQKDVKDYGKAKGMEKYSHDVVDPASGAQDTSVGGILFGNAGFSDYEAGLQQLRNQGGLIPTAIADVGGVLDQGGHALAGSDQTLFGGGGNGGAGQPATKAAAKPAAAATAAPPSAAEALMNSLVSQYQAGMATVDPYIGGSNAAGFASQAQAIGQGAAGAGVAAQDSAQAAMLGKDAAAVQKANDAGSQGVAQALTDTGKADQAFLNVSPYLGVLNALTSEAQYKTETGAPPTSITGSKMPAWLAQAYQSTVGASPSGAATVGTTTTPNPSTSATTPSTDTSSVAGGGNG